jgi:predicted 3-demethylubiquinone-9 3-methyltransferase (glyoxalase superfamily)
VPAQLSDLIRNPNAFAAMLTMVKIDIAQLQRAAME